MPTALSYLGRRGRLNTSNVYFQLLQAIPRQSQAAQRRRDKYGTIIQLADLHQNWIRTEFVRGGEHSRDVIDECEAYEAQNHVAVLTELFGATQCSRYDERARDGPTVQGSARSRDDIVW